MATRRRRSRHRRRRMKGGVGITPVTMANANQPSVVQPQQQTAAQPAQQSTSMVQSMMNKANSTLKNIKDGATSMLASAKNYVSGLFSNPQSTIPQNQQQQQPAQSGGRRRTRRRIKRQK